MNRTSGRGSSNTVPGPERGAKRVQLGSSSSAVVGPSILGSINVGVGEEGSVTSKAFIEVVEHRRSVARNGVVVVFARECRLVEDGLLATDERVVHPLLQATSGGSVTLSSHYSTCLPCFLPRYWPCDICERSCSWGWKHWVNRAKTRMPSRLDCSTLCL